MCEFNQITQLTQFIMNSVTKIRSQCVLNKFDKIFIIIDHDHERIIKYLNETINDPHIFYVLENVIFNVPDSKNISHLRVWDLFDLIDNSRAQYYLVAVVNSYKLKDYLMDLSSELCVDVYLDE